MHFTHQLYLAPPSFDLPSRPSCTHQLGFMYYCHFVLLGCWPPPPPSAIWPHGNFAIFGLAKCAADNKQPLPAGGGAIPPLGSCQVAGPRGDRHLALLTVAFGITIVETDPSHCRHLGENMGLNISFLHPPPSRPLMVDSWRFEVTPIIVQVCNIVHSLREMVHSWKPPADRHLNRPQTRIENV